MSDGIVFDSTTCLDLGCFSRDRLNKKLPIMLLFSTRKPP